MGEIFPYVTATNEFGETGLVPSIPIHLHHDGRGIHVDGLIDTSSAVNVLPYSIGIALGCVWDDHRATLRLAGNLERFRAQGVLVQATVGDFKPVELAFAWTELNTAPLLLGQVNFLMNFDVSFYRSRSELEISPKLD